MSGRGRHPGPAELGAWIDGELRADRHARIGAHVAGCARCARLVEAYRAGDRRLREAFSSATGGRPETPAERLLDRARGRRRRRLRAATATAATVIVAVAAVAPWRGRVPSPDVWPATLGGNAVQAYRLYADGPADVRTASVAPDPERLGTWLEDALGRPVERPRLEELGYRLLDARLVPAGSRPAAMLLYGGPGGEWIACYFVARAGNGGEGLRFRREGRVAAFYAIDDDLGYAVAGELDRARLRTVARHVYTEAEGMSGE